MGLHRELPARRAWVRERYKSLALLALATPLTILCLVACLQWPGRTFPGFFLLRNGMVPSVGLYHWTGWNRVSFHHQVTSANGMPIRSQQDLYALAERTMPGTSIRYDIRGDPESEVVDVPTMRFGAIDFWLTLAPFLLNGVLVIAMAVIVGLLQPHAPEATAFVAFGGIFGVLLLTGPPLYDPVLSRLTTLNLLAQAAWPAGFLHLGFVFPIVRPFAERHRAWLIVPYAVSVAIGVWCVHAFDADPPSFFPIHVLFAYTSVAMAVVAGSFVQAYWTAERTIVRRRLRVVLVGFVLASTVAFLGLLDNANKGGTFPINLSILTPFFFYLAVGWSIVRHDLFDIDRLIKQAAVYTLLTMLVTAGYALTVVVVGWMPSSRVITTSPVFVIAFVVVIAIAFEPLRRRVQVLVDRLFFRTRLDYRETISSVSAALTSSLDVDDVLARVGTTLGGGLSPSSLLVLLWLEDETRTWRLAPNGTADEVTTPATSALHAHLLERPRGAWRIAIDHASASESDALREARALGANLVVPLVRANRVMGAFVLGPRRSGVPYGSSDVALIETLAAQSAVALQNALLFRELTTLNEALESKVSARTADLAASNDALTRAYRTLQDTQAQLLQSEKMASLGQLVAGMAHEINTPVTAVVGNVKPLARELDRLGERAARDGDAALAQIIARMAAIFDVMARGAERTAAIVRDLRVFSRVDETRPLPMDLHEGIDVSLRLLRPRWADRIVVETRYGDLPPVAGAAGQLNQVFMNVLANACDAIADTGTIRIETTANATHVTVRVHDDGAGIRPEIMSRVFDPFFTTKPVGHGMGLGLAICAGIVAGHGGTMDLTSAPGVGTTVTVVLPIEAPPGPESTDDPSP